MSVEIHSTSELQSGKLYHVRIVPPFVKEEIEEFIDNLHKLNIRAVVTSGNYEFGSIKHLFEKITPEEKKELLSLLQNEEAQQEPEDEKQGKFVFNPENHFQTR